MENKSNISNLNIVSPNSITQKRLRQAQDMGSPKFTRKRQDCQTFFGRKTEIRPEQNQPITFISPKKYIQHHTGGTDSYKSITSASSFSRFEKPEKLNSQFNDQLSNVSTNSIASLIQPKAPSSRVFESAQQIIARAKANKDCAELKNKTQNYDKKINELNEKIKNLKEENNYLYTKIEDFNGIIGQKNAIINQFSMMLKQKQHAITFYQNQIQFYKRKNQQLEGVIILLNKSVQECVKCACNNVTVQTADDSGERHKEILQQEIQKYKAQIQQLFSKVKYSQIQTNIVQKMRYDLDTQVGKNEQLKQQNRKLLLKIQQLTQKNKNIFSERNIVSQRKSPFYVRGHNNNQNRSRQSQISLQLSPQKSQKSQK